MMDGWIDGWIDEWEQYGKMLMKYIGVLKINVVRLLKTVLKQNNFFVLRHLQQQDTQTLQETLEG